MVKEVTKGCVDTPDRSDSALSPPHPPRPEVREANANPVGRRFGSKEPSRQGMGVSRPSLPLDVSQAPKHRSYAPLRPRPESRNTETLGGAAPSRERRATHRADGATCRRKVFDSP